MIIVYKRMSKQELDEAATDAKDQIAKWFQANPKRRVCDAELWYGRRYKINRTHISSDVDAAREDADK